MYAVVYISSTYIHKLYPTRFWLSFLDFSYSQHLRGNVLFRLCRMLLYSIMREINSVHFSSVSHPSSFSGKCPINIKYFPVSSTPLASPLIPHVHSFPAGIAHDFYVLPASRYHSCIFIDCVMPFIEAPFNVCFVINSNSNIFLSSSIRVRIQHPAWITQRAVCSCERDIGIKTSKCDLIVDLKAPYIIMCYLIFELLTVGLTSRVSPDVTNLPEQVGEAEGLLHGASGEVRVEPCGLGGPYLLPGHHCEDALLSVLIGSSEPEGSVEGLMRNDQELDSGRAGFHFTREFHLIYCHTEQTANRSRL